MLTMLNTWRTGDVTKIHGDPDLQTALGRIKAKGLIMPSKTDLYFPVRFTRYVADKADRLAGSPKTVRSKLNTWGIKRSLRLSTRFGDTWVSAAVLPSRCHDSMACGLNSGWHRE